MTTRCMRCLDDGVIDHGDGQTFCDCPVGRIAEQAKRVADFRDEPRLVGLRVRLLFALLFR